MKCTLLDPSKHDGESFDCKNRALNNFLKHIANQNAKRDLSRTYILSDKEKQSRIIGFYTLSLIHISLEDTPKKLQKKYGSTLVAGLIARLGVDKRYQKRGYGSILLVDALLRLLSASEEVGFAIVVVDAKEGMSKFYSGFGFTPFLSNPDKLYMSIKDIRASFKANEKV